MTGIMGMSEQLTNADIVELRRKLFDIWEGAANNAFISGNWLDADTSWRVFLSFHEQIRELYVSGAFSGDAATALLAWEKLLHADKELKAMIETGPPPP